MYYIRLLLYDTKIIGYNMNIGAVTVKSDGHQYTLYCNQDTS